MNLEFLRRPFPTDQIKHRRTSIGMMVAYLETPVVINRLNEVFNGEWSFEILEHKFLDDDVVVLGQLKAEGITKQQFGTCELHQDTEDGVVLSMGDALKAAASDALKKTATLFGIGLQLYGITADDDLASEEEQSPDAPESEPADAEPQAAEPPVTEEASPQEETANDELDDLLNNAVPASDRVTDMQLAEIINLARKRKFTQGQVDQRARSRYGRGLAEITQDEAQDIIEKLKGN